MIVFCADTHLDERTWAARPTLAGDSMFSFSEIIRHAVENRAEAVVCAGDLFDVRKPPSVVLRFFRKQMELLAKNDIPFYYIQGQHDLSTPPWANAVSDHPILMDTAGVIELPSGVKLYGFSWCNIDALKEKIAQAPQSDIFVCHQVWRELMGDHIQSENSLENITSAGVVFTGDFHAFRMFTVENVAGDEMTIISPGSTNMRKIDEPPQKYLIECHVDEEQGSLLFERKEISTRQFQHFSILDIVDLEDGCQLISEFVSKSAHPKLGRPLVRVSISQSIPGGVRRLMTQFGETAHLFFKMVAIPDDEEPISDFDIIEDFESKSTLVDCLSLVVSEQDPSFPYLKRLLGAPDFELELLKIRDEFIGAEDADKKS